MPFRITDLVSVGHTSRVGVWIYQTDDEASIVSKPEYWRGATVKLRVDDVVLIFANLGKGLQVTAVVAESLSEGVIRFRCLSEAEMIRAGAMAFLSFPHPEAGESAEDPPPRRGRPPKLPAAA
jgi:UDP-glucose 6-dehydrogenase